MTSVKIDSQLIPATVTDIYTDPSWNFRDSELITVALSYNEVKALFVDNVPWSIVVQYDDYVNPEGQTITPEPVEIDKSEYCISGEILDRRDGKISIKMGKLTKEELLEQQLSNSVTPVEYETAYSEGVNSL